LKIRSRCIVPAVITKLASNDVETGGVVDVAKMPDAARHPARQSRTRNRSRSRSAL
jgi:hypothetical protein